MAIPPLLSVTEVQSALTEWMQTRRKALKLSRRALAELSTVPAPTIRHFEMTGQISLGKFLLLWQCLDQLQRIADLTTAQPSEPSSIEDVLGE